MDVLEDVSKTTVKLIIKEPFYGHYFTHIQRLSNKKIDRLAISFNKSGNIFLEINPDYWQRIETMDHKIGSIKHQILHLVFKHVQTAANFGNQHLFGVAADLVVNQYLTAQQLDPDALTLNTFKQLNLKPSQSVSYYYNKLRAYEGIHKVLIPPGEAKAEQKESEKHSGTACAGNGDDKGDDGDGAGNGDGGERNGEDFFGDKPGKNDRPSLGPLTEHVKWKSMQELSGAEGKLIEDKLDRYIELSASRVHDKDFGLLPGIVQEYIREALDRLNPSVNWKRLLRLYAASSRKTYLKNTIKKVSKRYATIPGIKIKQRQKILVAIDSSGSVSEEELQDFFSEINHVYRQSSEITVLECDVKIHKQYAYKGIAPTIVSGRGGTDFDPPIHFANKSRYDLLIYFTDAYAPEPSIKCRTPIIWVISIEGISPEEWDFLPGRKIKMTKSSSH